MNDEIEQPSSYEAVAQLIKDIESDNLAQAEKGFAAHMQNKVSDVIDQMRVQVAQDMYGSSAEEEVEEIEAVEDSLDASSEHDQEVEVQQEEEESSVEEEESSVEEELPVELDVDDQE